MVASRLFNGSRTRARRAPEAPRASPAGGRRLYYKVKIRKKIGKILVIALKISKGYWGFGGAVGDFAEGGAGYWLLVDSCLLLVTRVQEGASVNAEMSSRSLNGEPARRRLV